MKRLLSIVLASMAPLSAAAAEIRFVTPLDGAQVFGATLLEVEASGESIDRIELLVDGVLVGVARRAPFRVVHDFGESTVSHSIEAILHHDGFRRSERATISTMPLMTEQSLTIDLVEVPLRIRGPGTPSAKDLIVRENGIDQRILEIAATRGPAHFTFVVDRSLSMGEGRLQSALEAVASILPRLRAGDSASLILFNHRVDRPIDLRTGADLHAARELAPSGGTSLREALASIREERSRIIITITDGTDRSSAIDEESALRKIGTSRTTVHALTLGNDASGFLRKATRQTGGAMVRSRAPSLRTDLQALFDEIDSRHVVIYQSTNSGAGWREISVRSARRSVSTDLARTRYYAK